MNGNSIVDIPPSRLPLPWLTMNQMSSAQAGTSTETAITATSTTEATTTIEETPPAISASIVHSAGDAHYYASIIQQPVRVRCSGDSPLGTAAFAIEPCIILQLHQVETIDSPDLGSLMNVGSLIAHVHLMSEDASQDLTYYSKLKEPVRPTQRKRSPTINHYHRPDEEFSASTKFANMPSVVRQSTPALGSGDVLLGVSDLCGANSYDQRICTDTPSVGSFTHSVRNEPFFSHGLSHTSPPIHALPNIKTHLPISSSNAPDLPSGLLSTSSSSPDMITSAISSTHKSGDEHYETLNLRLPCATAPTNRVRPLAISIEALTEPSEPSEPEPPLSPKRKTVYNTEEIWTDVTNRVLFDSDPITPRRALCGNQVSEAHVLPDLTGNLGVFFFFHDVGVCISGAFRIHISISRLNQAMPNTILASATSDVFVSNTATTWKGHYPHTLLSDHFSARGVVIPLKKTRRNIA
ncbi:hypothetical protein BASA60_004655 [Batrachochytrium salamandrivorans]|nr:hypothetical protein BASA62_004324 [Batrachochytrium salamandrivorans]KAH6576187.1 hypothetical protein BASA60_004655 [Batrachochytrium salamandrivorans]